MRVGSVVALALALALGMVGCGGSGPVKAKLFPVKGRVTVAGAPLTGCTLVLIPVKPVPGVDDGYSGVLNAKGEFELSTMTGKVGAAAGKYKVTFSMGAAAPDANSDAGRQAAMKAMTAGTYVPPGTETKQLPYPSEYGDFKTSPKEVEISSESNELLIAI